MEQSFNKETIIYGGAFNPPTLAHLAILNACIEYAKTNQADVWVVPSANRTDKVIAASRNQRIAYIDAMIHDSQLSSVSLEVITTELDRGTLIETYDTVQELKEQFPERDFRFVFGADSTETMASWQNGEELLEQLPMLVVERQGSRVNPLARHAMHLNVVTPNISSTQVRERLALGESVEDLVTTSVIELLKEKV